MPAKKGGLKPYKRHLMIYDLLKRSGPLSVTDVFDTLKERGFKLIRKTIERDLKETMARDGSFGICSTEGERPERFYVMEGHDHGHQILLTGENIQVLAMALHALRKTAAAGFERFLDELEIAVRQRIPKDLSEALFVSYQQQLIQYGPGGRAKKSTAQEVTEVFRALREGRSITCHYDSQNSPEKKEIRKFGPISIEFNGGVFYLLASDLQENEHPVKRLKLSRMRQVKLLPEQTIAPPKKHIEKYLNNFGALGGPRHPPVEIRICGDKALATLFEEREYSPDQQIEPMDDGSWQVKLSTAESLPLARLLAGYGGHIFEIHPSALKEKVKNLWREGLKKAV